MTGDFNVDAIGVPAVADEFGFVYFLYFLLFFLYFVIVLLFILFILFYFILFYFVLFYFFPLLSNIFLIIKIPPQKK